MGDTKHLLEKILMEISKINTRLSLIETELQIRQVVGKGIRSTTATNVPKTSMEYFKKIVYPEDPEGVRNEFNISDDVYEEIISLSAIKNKKNEEDRLRSIAHKIWSKLEKPQKDIIAGRYKRYKQNLEKQKQDDEGEMVTE